jgi:hypothetical protein
MACCDQKTRRAASISLVFCTAAWTLCGLGWAQAPASNSSQAERVAQLIANLGSEEYALRESASEELAQIGLPAYTSLKAAANHPDREVRYRSQRVLKLIERHDVQRRLDDFLSGKEGAGDQLPGWSRFRKAYGDDAQARALFVSIQRAEPELMQALQEGPRVAAEAVGQRANQHHQTLQAGNQQLSMGQVAATLFVAAENDVLLSTLTLNTLLSHCHQAAFREVMTAGGPPREIPRKMLGAVIRRSDESTASQAMSVAYQYSLPEGITPAEKILSKPGGASAPMAQLALMTMVRLGNASHLPLVEKLLTDTSTLSRMQDDKAIYEVQLRDAALAAAVLLTKQDIKSYFDVPANQSLSDPQRIFFDARVIGFTSAEKRSAVFQKWARYRAQQTAKQASEKS